MLSLKQQNEWREQYRQMHPGWQPATERYADLVRTHLFPQARVLDVGCGRGGLVEQLHHPLSQVVGIDPDTLSLHEHRLDLPRLAAWSHQLPFANNVFDVAFCSWLFEHLAQPVLTLQEVGRVLRPGGVFIFVTPNGRHPLTQLNRIFGRFSHLQSSMVEKLYGRSAADTFPTYYRANSLTDLQTLSQHTRLTLTTCYTVPDPTYLVFHPALFRSLCWLENHLPDERKLHLVGILQRQA